MWPRKPGVSAADSRCDLWTCLNPVESRQPIEKPKRLVDPGAIAECREFGRCEYCGKPDTALHVHHVSSRGAGGDDEDTNLILLCWEDHLRFHNGQIKSEELRQIIANRLARESAITSFACINCPSCRQNVGISIEGENVVCQACGAVLMRI